MNQKRLPPGYAKPFAEQPNMIPFSAAREQLIQEISLEHPPVALNRLLERIALQQRPAFIEPVHRLKDAGLQLLRSELILDEIIVGFQLNRPLRIMKVLIAGQEDQPHLRLHQPERLRQLQAVHTGQPDIDDGQIRQMFMKQLQRRPAAGSGRDMLQFQTRLFQQKLHIVEHRHVVINQHDRHHAKNPPCCWSPECRR
ncbi:hypothetical protein D3C71_1201570 [compost metagenome]